MESISRYVQRERARRRARSDHDADVPSSSGHCTLYVRMWVSNIARARHRGRRRAAPHLFGILIPKVKMEQGVLPGAAIVYIAGCTVNRSVQDGYEGTCNEGAYLSIFSCPPAANNHPVRHLDHG